MVKSLQLSIADVWQYQEVRTLFLYQRSSLKATSPPKKDFASGQGLIDLLPTQRRLRLMTRTYWSRSNPRTQGGGSWRTWRKPADIRIWARTRASRPSFPSKAPLVCLWEAENKPLSLVYRVMISLLIQSRHISESAWLVCWFYCAIKLPAERK